MLIRHIKNVNSFCLMTIIIYLFYLTKKRYHMMLNNLSHLLQVLDNLNQKKLKVIVLKELNIVDNVYLNTIQIIYLQHGFVGKQHLLDMHLDNKIHLFMVIHFILKLYFVILLNISKEIWVILLIGNIIRAKYLHCLKV